MTTKIRGLEETTANLNRAIAQIAGRTRAGMLEGALFIESESVPRAPVKTGNLRGSAFTDITPPGETPIVARVGYTAEYAPYVHEMPRKSDVGPLNDRSTQQLTGPRKPSGRTFTKPRKTRSAAERAHTPWAPGTGPKFLQQPLFENARELLFIIASRAKIGGR